MSGVPLDHSATQRSLEQASATIESAYRRIRQVRRNLLNMIDSIPDPTQRFAQETSGMRPGHEAITLTEPPRDSNVLQSVNLGVRPEMLSVTVMEERLRQLEARMASNLRAAAGYNDSDSPLLTNANVQSHSDSLNSSSSHRPHPLPRPTHSDWMHLRRQEMDDPNTSLGRRVAAREANGPDAAANPTSTTSGILARLDEHSAFFASLEREIQNFRSAMTHQRHAGPGSTTMSSNRSDGSRFSEMAPRSPFRRGAYVPSLLTGPGVNSTSDSRRRRIHGTPPVQSPSLTAPSERLSLLSNFSSVQNFPTPASPVSRPLIFDEPTSYAPTHDFTPSADVRDEPPFYDDERRSYIVRRRYNADGEEHVHPINLEWIHEEPPTWLLPRGIPQGESVQDHGTPPSGSAARRQSQGRPPSAGAISASSQRRRGWARLDPDGNEIPSDEEEETERLLIEHRIQLRSQVRSRGLPLRNSDVRPNFVQGRDVTTVPPDDENNLHPEGIPRVRLNGRVRRGTTEPLIPAGRSAKTSSAPLFETSSTFPFRPDPLPMPLEEMVCYPLNSKTPRAARVHHHASFAGR